MAERSRNEVEKAYLDTPMPLCRPCGEASEILSCDEAEN
jgi:hypothetical protein